MSKKNEKNQNNVVTFEEVNDRAKPFVAFLESEEAYEYKGAYTSLNHFAKEFGLPSNNLRPVLSGKVRSIKNFILFYVDDTEEGGEPRTGYNTWLTSNGREIGDFPDEIYFEKGYIRGHRSRLPMVEILKQLKKLGWAKS